ncbi:unnamed protein product [Pseudo-nitzschia multistriata]|nr:unnamed protein product [Pseudo-nitzschia multistriata]
MNGMFFRASYLNQPIGDWDVSGVNDMAYMFHGAIRFNQPVGDWNMSRVTYAQFMFFAAHDFNQPISDWNMSSLTDAMKMFYVAYDFNQPIGDWDTSSLKNARGMLGGQNFNQPIGDWDTSSVTDMSGMFSNTTSFDQPIGTWNTSSVEGMGRMFYSSHFNQPLDEWDVSAVAHMFLMFDGATNFNQCLGSWAEKTPDYVSVFGMFDNSACPNTSDPDKTKGPWCQTSNDSCGHLVSSDCANEKGFTIKRKYIECNELSELSDRERNALCRKKVPKQACPGVCDRRCICKDKKRFSIKKNRKHIFKGSYKCRNVGKQNQPSCDTKAKKRLLVKDLCPKKCDSCLT